MSLNMYISPTEKSIGYFMHNGKTESIVESIPFKIGIRQGHLLSLLVFSLILDVPAGAVR